MRPAIDPDPIETQEWLESLDAVAGGLGPGRAQYLLHRLAAHAQTLGLATIAVPSSPYRNTIRPHQETPHPGDVKLEERLTALMRWNALAMVVRANKAYGE